MASRLKPFWLLPISILLFFLIINWANADPQVPCYFVFGDSLSDNGNNNELKTLAKVNYQPYGIDFPQGPTGRFSNGRNMQDVLVELLGFKDYITPFAKANETNIFQGVNYASGSAGIRDETGQKLGVRVPLNAQLTNHKTIISRIRNKLGDPSATKLLSQCIYSLDIGSNDYINNYFQPEFYSTSRQYTVEKYAAVLVEQFSQQIKTLYDDGARKFAMYGLGLIGCTPITIGLFGNKGCANNLNNAAIIFNDKLKTLVRELSAKLSDAKFTYLSPSPQSDEIKSFVSTGSCCKTGGGGGELCVANSKPCENRDKYVFWDGVHPTDAWNVLTAKSAYQTISSDEAAPYNIMNLAKL